MKFFPRLPMSIVCAVMVATLSYTIQRLVDAQNEPPMGTVLLQASIPYYWRIAMSTLHALAAGILVYTLSPKWNVNIVPMVWCLSFVFLVCIASLIAVP